VPEQSDVVDGPQIVEPWGRRKLEDGGGELEGKARLARDVETVLDRLLKGLCDWDELVRCEVGFLGLESAVEVQPPAKWFLGSAVLDIPDTSFGVRCCSVSYSTGDFGSEVSGRCVVGRSRWREGRRINKAAAIPLVPRIAGFRETESNLSPLRSPTARCRSGQPLSDSGVNMPVSCPSDAMRGSSSALPGANGPRLPLVSAGTDSCNLHLRFSVGRSIQEQSHRVARLMKWVAHLAEDHAMSSEWKSIKCSLCGESMGAANRPLPISWRDISKKYISQRCRRCRNRRRIGYGSRHLRSGVWTGVQRARCGRGPFLVLSGREPTCTQASPSRRLSGPAGDNEGLRDQGRRATLGLH
jgi:hypothetical protein